MILKKNKMSSIFEADEVITLGLDPNLPTEEAIEKAKKALDDYIKKIISNRP